LRQETGDAVGGLGALADPFLDAFQLQGDAVRVILLQQGIIGTDLSMKRPSRGEWLSATTIE